MQIYCIKKTFLFICFQNIFSEFITIEMLFHGKALEIYTAAYQNIQNIDENEDLEVRVIEICFSVYLLYKNSFHNWARHFPHRKMQQIFQVPRRNSCIPSFFFCTSSARACRFVISENTESNCSGNLIFLTKHRKETHKITCHFKLR